MDRHEFLVVCDFGMGGLWEIMNARRADEIVASTPRSLLWLNRRLG